jgi:hypothetical protein
MTATASTATEIRKCLGGCGRTLRSTEAVARGYGSGCWAKIRKAAKVADLSAWTPSQITEAEQAIEDGAVVPSTREGVFHVVSADGSEVHRTAEHGCNCTAGLKTHHPRPCWHRCAVAMVLAASAPAAPAAVTTSAPIALPAPAPVSAPDDVWAALEAVGALDLMPAF